MIPTGVKTNPYSRLVCYQCYDIGKVNKVTTYDVACSRLRGMRKGNKAGYRKRTYHIFEENGDAFRLFKGSIYTFCNEGD